MKKLFISLFLLVIISAYGISQNFESVIEPELQEAMSVNKKGELISINIILNAQYDQQELLRKSQGFMKKADRKAFVIKELQDFAKATQTGLLESLSYLRGMSEIKDIKSHWLCNSINCMASVDAINEIALNPDVLIIGYNKEQYLLFGEEATTPAKNIDEITQNILQVNADDVWALGYTGEGVIVAVVDTGVNYNHLDLNDHLWSTPEYPNHGYDFYNNDNDPMDDMGHGTHCAGTVCGDGTAGSQTGMAPDATLMCVKVLSSGGNGNLNQICNGMEFAIEQGADLFSMSLGFAGGGSESERITFRNVTNNSLAVGVVGIIAAGNEGGSGQYPVPNNIRVPGNCPPPWLHPDQTLTGGLSCVISIGAVDYNDNAAYFTSHGPVTWQNISGFNDYPYNPGMGLIRPDVCAPGVDIKSLNYSGTSGYTTMSGTSMATPCTAGVVCLLLSKNSELLPDEIDEILETTAKKLSDTKSNIYGSGRIDALAAIEEVVNGPIVYSSCEINDSQTNGDGLLNPGETVSLNIAMENIAQYPVNNTVVTLVCDDPLVTIIDSIAEFGNFEIGQLILLENAFALSLSEDAPIGTKLKLMLKVNSDTTFCKNNFKIVVYDYLLDVANISIYDSESGNGNGMLDPGETADISIYISNLGNEAAKGLEGHLTTTSEYLTINNSNAVFGTCEEGQTKFARFNATLSSSVPNNNYPMPLNLLLTDKNERVTEKELIYTNNCNVVFDLYDSGGNGWQGAYLYVHYDDGTPTDTLTVPSGKSSFSRTISINFTTVVSLTWLCGADDNECSFDISYEAGDLIYHTCCSHAGVFYSWENNCLGSISQICEKPTSVEATPSGNTVILNWNAPTQEGLEGYYLYRDDNLIATLTTTTFTDVSLENGIYFYSVEAFYEDGCISEPTDYISVEITNEQLLGDVNGDNVVNNADIVLVISYIFNENPNPFIFENADVNSDGIINIQDIFGIIQIIFSNSNK